MSTSSSETDHDRQRDIRRVAKILRDGNYSYDQSKHLFARAREEVGLSPPKRETGSVRRLNTDEVRDLLDASYNHLGATKGLMVRTLLETATRVGTFCELRVQHLSLTDQEIEVVGKGNKRRPIPIRDGLCRELRQHIGDRRTGYLFPSPHGGHYSKRRVQQIVKEAADHAGIAKRVYPHLLRHTMAQYLADRGMPENLLQKFLGHERPETTQIYYEPSRSQMKDAFDEATGDSSS
jgi:integrase/recombinase XerD